MQVLSQVQLQAWACKTMEQSEAHVRAVLCGGAHLHDALGTPACSAEAAAV